MPTYQYACTNCGHRFDAVQSFSDPSLTECPACSGTLRKVFSSVGIVFKGSGFYRTDSRAGATVSPGETKTETKSEPKKEAAASPSSSSSTAPSSSPGSSAAPAAAAS